MASRDVGRPRAGRPGRRRPAGYRRFAWTPHRRRRCASGSPARRRPRGHGRSSPTGPATSGPGRRTRTPHGPGLVLGSHLDSVPDGGAFDGPLGDRVGVRRAGPAARARRPPPAGRSGIACFADEEGARFGVACAGSRLLTGALDADRARALTDADGHDDGRGDVGRRASTPTPRPGRRDARAGSAPSSSCTSSRAARWSTAAPGRRGRRRSGRTAAGGWTSAAGPTTRAPPGWPTATTRCSRSPPRVQEARAAAERHGALATVGKVRVAAERGQRDPVGGHRLARRPRAGRGRRPRGGRRRSARAAGHSTRSRSPGRRRPPSIAALRDRLAAPARRRHPVLPHRRRARRRDPGGGRDPDRDAVRPQPDRRLPLPRRARRAGRLPRRRRRPRRGRSRSWRERPTGASTPGSTTARWPACASPWSTAAGSPSVEVAGPAPGDAAAARPRRCPGSPNAHSHAFHRALRGRTHDARRHVLDLARADVRRRRAARPRQLPGAGPGHLRRDGAGRRHLRRRVPLPAPPAGGGRYADPNAMSEALVQAAADAGVRLTLLDTCYLAGGLDADGHLPLDDVQQRFSDGDADALGRPGRRAARAAGPADRRGGALGARRARRRSWHRRRAAAGAARCTCTCPSSRRRTRPRCAALRHARPTALLADRGRARPGHHRGARHPPHRRRRRRSSARTGTAVCACPSTEADLADGVGPVPPARGRRVAAVPGQRPARA